jgi:hypothetical protein
MPYTGEFENAALTAMLKSEKPTPQPVAVGLAKGATAVSFTAATIVLTKAGHGYTSKDVVELKAATVGASALVVGRIYYAKVIGANEIELFDIYALTGTAITVEGATGVELVKIEEDAGATYVRVAVTWNAAAERKAKSAAEYSIKTDAGRVVDYILYFTTTESNKAGQLLAVAKVTKETFGAAGEYKVKEGVLDLAAAA